MNAHRLIILSALLISLVGVVCCQSEMNGTTTEVMPSVTVMDQTAVGNSMIANVTVAKVISDGPGWIVIQNDLFGRLGGVIGYAHVDNGSNSNINITFDPFVATDSLFAVLYYDREATGLFTYPTIDKEHGANGQIVMEPFRVGTMWDAMLMNLTQMARDASAE